MKEGVRMPIIKPISDLRNNFAAISETCHREGEPVFITKNGEGDLVVMSMAAYEQREATLDLYAKLLEARERKARGEASVTRADAMSELRARVRGKKA
jgi:prevent-host-death family protein